MDRLSFSSSGHLYPIDYPQWKSFLRSVFLWHNYCQVSLPNKICSFSLGFFVGFLLHHLSLPDQLVEDLDVEVDSHPSLALDLVLTYLWSIEDL